MRGILTIGDPHDCHPLSGVLYLPLLRVDH